MNFLDSVKNLLNYINENWTVVVIIFGLCLALAKKIDAYLKLSKEEKIAIAKEQLRETVLKFVTDAEIDYSEWVKAGAVKRAQVVKAIFEQYPILSRVTDQDRLIAEIDELIDSALDDMRNIIEENKNKAT